MSQNTTLCLLEDHIEECDSVPKLQYMLLLFGIGIVFWMILSSIIYALLGRYSRVLYIKYFTKNIKNITGKKIFIIIIKSHPLFFKKKDAKLEIFH